MLKIKNIDGKVLMLVMDLHHQHLVILKMWPIQGYQLHCSYFSNYNSAFGGNISSYEGRPSSKSIGAGWSIGTSKCLDVSVVEYDDSGLVRRVFWWADLDEGSTWVNLQKEHGMQLYIPFKQTHALSIKPKPPMLHKINPRSISSGLSYLL